MEETIVTVPIVTSPFLEEIHAAFDSISRLESLLLSQETPNVSSLHHSAKRLYGSILQYCGHAIVNEIDASVKNTPNPDVPTSLMSFYTSFDPKSPPQQPAPQKIIKHEKIPDIRETVELLKYPQIHSVQFSYIDTQEQLDNLISQILAPSENAIGVYVIDHLFPQEVCALCISTRECEYLIDMVELPKAIESFGVVFAKPEVVKVIFNCSHCCRLLHQMGIQDIYNVFEITAAAQHLGLSPSLEDLTLEFRGRLNEGWISESMTKPIVNESPASSCDPERLSKVLTDAEASSEQDWRIHPLSLAQMRIARQRVHYLLYLYDSLRLKLTDGENSDPLSNAVVISHHKSEMDWSGYKFVLQSPNATILSRIYNQPVPNAALVRALMDIRQQEAQPALPQFALSDAAITWIALTAPKNQKALENALVDAAPKHRTMFTREVPEIPKSLATAILAAIEKQPPAEAFEQKPQKQKTLQEIITEIGWLPDDGQLDAPKKQEEPILLETTVSPRVAKNAAQKGLSTPAGAYLKHLRDPDQPTSVSKQIEGIPKTEAQIFALANNVRLLQKMNGKTKTKLAATKEDVITDESPDDVLRSLLSMGYIDETEVNAIKAKLSAPKPAKPSQKRGRSKDSKPPPSSSSQPRGNQPPPRRGRM